MFDFYPYKIKKISDLTPHDGNSRTHTPEQIQQIVKSIEEFGFTNPLIIQNNSIIAGHGRLEAAKVLGMLKVPTIQTANLSPKQIEALVIADNQIALNAGWDRDTLKEKIGYLKDEDYDINLLGFDDDFLSDLFEDYDPTIGKTDEDAVPELPETPISVLGDVWILGNHRLMCGDSTSIDAVDKLMDGKKADMVFTDPPYSILKNNHPFHNSAINQRSNLLPIQILLYNNQN